VLFGVRLDLARQGGLGDAALLKVALLSDPVKASPLGVRASLAHLEHDKGLDDGASLRVGRADDGRQLDALVELCR
jgi:hypothetical protein